MGRIINRNAIIGLPIICEETGSRLGIVEDVKCNLGLQKINSIIVVNMGYRTRFFNVDLDKIDLLNGVIITTKKDYLGNIDEPGKSNIIGKSVVDGTGQELGTLSNIIFNYDDGQVEGYEISRGIIDDLISGRSIMSADFDP